MAEMIPLEEAISNQPWIKAISDVKERKKAISAIVDAIENGTEAVEEPLGKVWR